MWKKKTRRRRRRGRVAATSLQSQLKLGHASTGGNPRIFEAKLMIRLHTVNNLACLAWAQQLSLPSFLGPGHTVVDFGCGFVFPLLFLLSEDLS